MLPDPAVLAVLDRLAAAVERLAADRSAPEHLLTDALGGALMLGISTDHFQRNAPGLGITVIKIGASVRYRISDIKIAVARSSRRLG